MQTSIAATLEHLTAMSGIEWQVDVIEGNIDPLGEYAVIFRSEEHIPRFEDIVQHKGFQCPSHDKGGYYAAGRGGIYFDATVSGAHHRYTKQIQNHHIFLCTVSSDYEIVHITHDNRLEVMRSQIVRDRLAYGVSAGAAQHAEYVKAVSPGDRFCPSNLLLLHPAKSVASQESDDAHQGADNIALVRDP